MSDEIENRIKAAALELSKALTEHGGDFYVSANAIETTCIEDFDRRFGYSVLVKLMAEKQLAP